MRILDGVGLDFDDVYLVPQRSSLNSRSEVILQREFKELGSIFPIVIANMDGCGTFEMADACVRHNMPVALHKFYPVDELISFFQQEK